MSFSKNRGRRLGHQRRAAIIDGEIVVPAANGSTGFSVLQNEPTSNTRWRSLQSYPIALTPTARNRVSSKSDTLRRVEALPTSVFPAEQEK
jgi:hypothetical protein